MPTSTEYITINSVVLALDGAWELVDPTPLLGEGPTRGDNLVVSDADGVTYRDKERGPLREVLQLEVYGTKDHTGSAHPDYRSGMRDNLEYLRNQLLSVNVGQVSLVYTFPDAGTVTGNCEVHRLVPSKRGDLGNITLVAMDIEIHAGRLT